MEMERDSREIRMEFILSRVVKITVETEENLNPVINLIKIIKKLTEINLNLLDTIGWGGVFVLI